MKVLRTIRNLLLLLVFWGACVTLYLWAHTKLVFLAVFAFFALFLVFWFLGQLLPARQRAHDPNPRRPSRPSARPFRERR